MNPPFIQLGDDQIVALASIACVERTAGGITVHLALAVSPRHRTHRPAAEIVWSTLATFAACGGS